MLKTACCRRADAVLPRGGFARAEDAGPFRPTQPAGYFFVGGRYETTNSKTTALGQMFVEYRAPARITQPYPVVMVHGTAQTGTNFLGTPDGRPGWADRFAAKGFAVYVVDQVGRGRSGGDAEIYGPYARLPMEDLETVFTGRSGRRSTRRRRCTPNGRAARACAATPPSTSSTARRCPISRAP